MREFLDYDPWTGIATYTEQLHRDKEIAVHQECDVQPLIEAQKHRRGYQDKEGPGGLRLVANLDMVTIMQLKKRGFDVMQARTKEDWAPILRVIETEYPALKATETKFWRPAGQETKSPGIIVK